MGNESTLDDSGDPRDHRCGVSAQLYEQADEAAGRYQERYEGADCEGKEDGRRDR